MVDRYILKSNKIKKYFFCYIQIFEITPNYQCSFSITTIKNKSSLDNREFIVLQQDGSLIILDIPVHLHNIFRNNHCRLVFLIYKKCQFFIRTFIECIISILKIMTLLQKLMFNQFLLKISRYYKRPS